MGVELGVSGWLAYTTFRNPIPPLMDAFNGRLLDSPAGQMALYVHFGWSGANFIGGAEIFVTETGWPFRNSNIPSLIFGEERNNGSL